MQDKNRILIRTIEQRVLSFCDKYQMFSPGDRVLVALSGGGDSVFALHFLYKYNRRFGITLGAAHINHALRAEESEGDEAFCRELSARMNVEFYSTRLNLEKYCRENKYSVEEGARELRYKFLEETAAEYGYDRIVTAHNAGDNTETMLLNLIKGTGLRGISGIPVMRGRIVRPLMCLKKSDILEYLAACRIEYRTDRTNFENVYQRNLIRNDLIPVIKRELNPNIEESLLNSSQIFRDLNSIIEEYAGHVVEDTVSYYSMGVVVDLVKLYRYNQALFGSVFKMIIEDKLNRQYTYRDYEKILELMSKQSGRIALISRGLRAYRTQNEFYIEENAPDGSFEPVVMRPGDEYERNGEKIKIFLIENDHSEELNFDNGPAEYISGDDVGDEFILRRPVRGERFRPLGMKGEKKVSDFLSELKLPRHLRERQLILASGDNVVWVVGYRIDERFKISKNTKRIIKLCLE